MRSQSQPAASEPLGIVLDRDAEVPLGVQLAWALRARIHDGRLAPEQRLPALRDLAEGLGVNTNTIRAVYQRLEHEGLLCSLQGSGTFVTAAPRTGSVVSAIAAAAAREARQTGVDPREVAAALYVAPEGEDVARDGDEQAERRRRLRTQITALEQTLAELEVANPRFARIARGRGRRPAAGPRLLDSTELEQVRTELLRRIAAIQTAIDRSGEEGTGAEKSDEAPAAKRRVRPRAIARPAASGT
jgi:DNA-binding transcriptional regulator YhcF (GntR family)